MDQHSKMNEQEAFNVFLNSGLHGGKWPNVVYCSTACYLDGEHMVLLAKNTSGGSHAEENMLNFLRDKIQNKSLRDSQKLTMYVNYSPCRNCSERIIEFIKEVKARYNIHLIFDIAFSVFYKIRRPSCESGCFTHKLPPYNVHERNVKGLKMLQDHGVNLRPMGRADWEYLAAQMNVSFMYTGSSREREDKVFKEDFGKVMNDAEATDDMNSLVSMFGRVRLRHDLTLDDWDVPLHHDSMWG